MLVGLAGPQDDLVLPGRDVDRVGELLRLEAEAGVLRLRGALALVRPVQEVARVELQPGLIGVIVITRPDFGILELAPSGASRADRR